MKKRSNIYGIELYNPPETILSPEEYCKHVIELGKGKNLSFAEQKTLQDFEVLRNDLYDLIAYNTDEIEVKGKKYYLSADGDDNNDGLTPETAWSTLKRITEFEFEKGDGVYLRRGDLWRGNMVLQSGVTYQAYGEGKKPQIFLSFDGKTIGEWVKTDIKNVWVLDTVLEAADIGLVVFDGGKKYGEKKKQISELENELDFYYSGNWVHVQSEKRERKLYLYCSLGNPNDVFSEIELSRTGHVIQIPNFSHDIKVHNLDMRYGQDFFFHDGSKNVGLTYCFFAWMGGHYGYEAINSGCYRYGGGGGVWRACENMKFEHCFFTQHFDCATTPQFFGDANEPCYFKNYSMKSCLVEYCEFSFEYYSTKKNGDDYGFQNMYLGYNIFSKCGQGFGDKHFASRHIKAWNHSSPCYNCVFEHNVFDRAYSLSLEYTSRDPVNTFCNGNSHKISYERLPLLRENIFIEPKNKPFASVNQITYNFNETSQITMKKLGITEGDIYIFDGDFKAD